MCLTQIYTARVGIRLYMSNRVEDLERQVAELQAAVNGLTEELVEMKERVRQVEDAQEVSVEADAPGADEPAATEGAGSDEATEDTESSGGTRTTHSDDHVDVVERTDEGSDEGTGASGGDASSGDVIVPEQEATTPDAEAAKSAESGDDGDDGESSDSDIIVA